MYAPLDYEVALSRGRELERAAARHRLAREARAAARLDGRDRGLRVSAGHLLVRLGSRLSGVSPGDPVPSRRA